MSTPRQLPKVLTGDPDIDRALNLHVDILNSVLRSLPPDARTHPTTLAVAAQSGVIYMGSGVPQNANGNNGDIFFRTDAPGTVNQRLYIRSAGAWIGIL